MSRRFPNIERVVKTGDKVWVSLLPEPGQVMAIDPRVPNFARVSFYGGEPKALIRSDWFLVHWDDIHQRWAVNE